MYKKIIMGSILAAVLIVLASFSSAVGYIDEDKVTIFDENKATMADENKVTITTTLYRFIYKEEISTEVTEEEAAEIRDCLENLNVALVEEDKNSIEEYEYILSEKGVLGEHNEIFSKKGIMGIPEKFSSIISSTYTSMSKDIENTFCIVNAEGHGNLTFFSEAVLEYFMLVGVVLLLVGLILLPLLPFALILLLGSALALPVVHIASHLVPFRIFNSYIGMKLVDGSCSIQGRNGTQDLTAPLNVTLRGFAGVTINFPIGENPYLFVSGFSLNTKTIEEE